MAREWSQKHIEELIGDEMARGGYGGGDCVFSMPMMRYTMPGSFVFPINTVTISGGKAHVKLIVNEWNMNGHTGELYRVVDCSNIITNGIVTPNLSPSIYRPLNYIKVEIGTPITINDVVYTDVGLDYVKSPLRNWLYAGGDQPGYRVFLTGNTTAIPLNTLTIEYDV